MNNQRSEKRVRSEVGKMPPDYRKGRQWRGRTEDGVVTVRLTLAQARAIEEFTRGVEPQTNSVWYALRNGGKRIASAMRDWLECRPTNGLVLGQRKDERLRMLRLKLSAQTGMRNGTDIAKRAQEMGYKLSEANISDIELGHSRNPVRHKLEGYCAATGIPFKTALELLPRNSEPFATRPVTLPEQVWAVIDRDEERLDEFLTRYFSGEAEEIEDDGTRDA